MNLLELMLKEEVEWPVGAEFAAQQSDNAITWFCSKPEFSGDWCGIYLQTTTGCRDLADDWSTRIITREEYQAAGGWMKWEGGECPVERGTLVDSRYSDGTNNEHIEAGVPGSKTGSRAVPWATNWKHSGAPHDIIAFRIIKQDESYFESFVSVEDAQECKAEYAATSKQSTPKGSGNPILGMVLADLTNRALEGKEKYGEPLKAHNGRNALWDAYQEALDLAMYLRQLIQEQQDA